MPAMASANTIIAQLGGPDAVARITGAKLNAIRQWDRIGIPYRFWGAVVDAAAASEVDGITFDVLRESKAEYLAQRAGVAA